MRRFGGPILLPIALPLILLLGAIRSPAHEVKQNAVQRRETKLPIADFVLIDQGGKTLQFTNLSGKVVVIAFAYTTCPDVCPLISAALRQVQINLSAAERKTVYLLTVTTDPEIDSPKVLAGYAKRYGAELDTWSFLTGDATTLKNLWNNFGVGVKRKARGLIDHTPLTAIVDQRGVLRFAYIGPAPDTKQVMADIRSLLADR